MSLRLALNSWSCYLPCAKVTGMYQHTWPIQWFWRHWIYWCVLQKNFKWSDIPNLDEYNMLSDYTKMILRLTSYHLYRIQQKQAELLGLIRFKWPPKWILGEEFHKTIEKPPQTPSWHDFSYWFYCIMWHKYTGLVVKGTNIWTGKRLTVRKKGKTNTACHEIRKEWKKFSWMI